jgi:carbon monoxide dehydrogenase subunit G
MILDFKIKKPLDFVFDHLTDMQKFVAVHPIIFKIDHLGENKYLVHERLKLGFFPLSFTYIVTVKGNPENKTVSIKTKVMKMVGIEMNYTLRSQADHTHVNEEIIFTSYLPVKPIMQKIFRKQHQQLFINMENASG